MEPKRSLAWPSAVATATTQLCTRGKQKLMSLGNAGPTDQKRDNMNLTSARLRRRLLSASILVVVLGSSPQHQIYASPPALHELRRALWYQLFRSVRKHYLKHVASSQFVSIHCFLPQNLIYNVRSSLVSTLLRALSPNFI